MGNRYASLPHDAAESPADRSPSWGVAATIKWCVGAYSRYTTSGCLMIVAPITVALIYFYGGEAMDQSTADGIVKWKLLLLMGIGLPMAALSWYIIWSVKSYMGEDRDILANSTAFCCCTIFFPIGIIVPVLVVGADDSLADKVAPPPHPRPTPHGPLTHLPLAGVLFLFPPLVYVHIW